MVMLYQDPDGHAVGKTPSSDFTMPNLLTTKQLNGGDEEKEMLLRRIEEKDSKINELTLQIKALMVAIANSQKHSIFLLLHFSDTVIIHTVC